MQSHAMRFYELGPPEVLRWAKVGLPSLQTEAIRARVHDGWVGCQTTAVTVFLS